MKFRMPALRVSAVALLVSAAQLAGAESSPWYLGVAQAFSYDSNVFRQVDEFAQSSWWSSTSLVGGFDQRQGRQRFFASGNVAANVYGELGELDNTSYGVNAGWDWETAGRLSGKLYASFDRNLADYGGFNISLQNEKNIRSAGLAYATVEYGLLSLMTADLRLAYSSVDYSLFTHGRLYDLDQAAITARVRKEFGGQLTAGVGLGFVQGDYPSLGQEFDRYDLFVTGDWQVTGQSTFRGRLGYSSAEYTGVNPYDRDGLRGWLVWEYTPSGKLRLDTTLSYDTLANAVFTTVGGGPAQGQGQNQRLTTGLELKGTYALTGKTALNASLQFFRQDRDDTRTVGGVPVFDNTRNQVTNLYFGATWIPTRNWKVNCSLTFNDRNQSGSSSAPISLLPYSAHGGSCSAQYVLQ